jgi:C_GCAxxG_C_C family probable redox protein
VISILNKVDRAVSCFKEGFACSQSIFSTYGDVFGLHRDVALKISCAFGGGMAGLGETCGAVTGALMVIGLKYGKEKSDDNVAKEKTYKFAREFINKFKSLNGSIKCKELLNCDISTPEGMKVAKEKNLFTTICPKLVRDSAEILEKLLL